MKSRKKAEGLQGPCTLANHPCLPRSLELALAASSPALQQLPSFPWNLHRYGNPHRRPLILDIARIGQLLFINNQYQTNLSFHSIPQSTAATRPAPRSPCL